MATMYAKSTLTVWNNAASGGWSNSSGGTDNGTFPDSTTDVVFDGNSGTSRSITITDGAANGNIPCKSLTTAAAAAMTFSAGSKNLNPYGDVDLTGSNWAGPINYSGGTPSNFKAGNSAITTFANNGAVVTLGADISMSGALTMSTSFSANNFNVTAASVACSGTVTMGSGTWTITGSSGTVWSASSTTIVPGTSTIKITGAASGVTFAGNGKTYANFWNATSAGTVTMTGANTFSNMTLSPGATQRFPNATTTTVSSFTADGTGGLITILSDSTGTAATLAKSGGGSVYVDRVSFKDITGSPGSTWNARSSTNVSGNSAITFIPGNSNFLSFF